MPKDRVTQQHQGYGFVEFLGEEDADYAIKIMNMIKVHGKPIRVNKVVIVSSYHCRLRTLVGIVFSLSHLVHQTFTSPLIVILLKYKK